MLGHVVFDIDPYDLMRVEVLRGPQGTLYGANTLGGLVKFVTDACERLHAPRFHATSTMP